MAQSTEPMAESNDDLNDWLFSQWLASQLEQRRRYWARFSREVEKLGRSMLRLELHIDAPPPGLPTCHRIACALDVSLVTVLCLAWVKSPIGPALQVAYLGSLFDQPSVEDQKALLEKQKEMVKAHRKAIERDDWPVVSACFTVSPSLQNAPGVTARRSDRIRYPIAAKVRQSQKEPSPRMAGALRVFTLVRAEDSYTNVSNMLVCASSRKDPAGFATRVRLTL